jgi:uncharacterized Fe-S cluster protein YjdI/CDGSH-type Zn-finger protein
MVETPDEAGIPRTAAPDRTYEAEGITVEWRAARCIHTTHCLQSLPSVFDTSARPWVRLGGADPEAVAAAVRRCPTGALRYSGPDLPPDDGGTAVSIDAQPDGPLYVRGPVTVTDHDDQLITEEPRMALCRCGASENKPYCDNSHRQIGWKEGGNQGSE